MAKILLAEARSVTREGIKQIVAAIRDMVVAAEADNAQEVLSEISRNHYDLLLLDTSLPGRSWLDLLKDLRTQKPNLRVLILSALADEGDATHALRAGASGYLASEFSPDELSSALRRVLGGGRYVSPSIAERLASDIQNGNGKPIHELLSDREYQVMRLLVSGRTISEIATDMSLSVKTISTYRSRVLEKLNLKNNVELALYYDRQIDVKANGVHPAEAPAPRRTEAGRRFFFRPRNRKWVAAASAIAMVVIGLVLWRTLLATDSIELKYDDGTSEAEIHADSGGYVLHFSQPSAPFIVDKIRVYGAVLPCDREEFDLQIWDGGQNVIYTASYPLKLFSSVATVPEARVKSGWVDIPIPGVEIKSDFLIHVFAGSGPARGLQVGVDDSTWNLHSSLSSVTSSGTYRLRDSWATYRLPTGASVWYADKSKVNWMIRVVGRDRGPSGQSSRPAKSPQAAGSTSPTRPATPTEPRPLPPPDAFMRGFTFADWKNVGYAPPGLYVSPGADQSLEALAATGTNWISLLVNIGQETVASTSIFRTQPRTATDEELRRMVDLAHDLGMRVMLTPYLGLTNDPKHATWEIGTAFDREEQWQAWFASYRDIIDHYAEFGEGADVDMLCVGRLLGDTTHREQDWRRLVAEARLRFKGPITYSSGSEYESMAWWDELDYVDMEPFWSLTDKNDPTLAELKGAWTDRGYLAVIEDMYKRFNKPIILEFGYESKDGVNRWVGDSYTMQLPVDLQEQADCYQAALEVLWGKPWLKGIFWWQWLANPQVWPGGPNDTTATPYLKPAAEVLRKFYLGQ